MKYISDEHIRILEKPAIDCCDVHNMMCDYADGDITESLKDRLDKHIAECDDCSDFKDGYMKVIELAASLKPAPLSNDVQNRLRKSLNERLGINLSMVNG